MIKCGLNAKLDAVRRHLKFVMTAGYCSDCTKAAAPLGSLPIVQWIIPCSDRDADSFQNIEQNRGMRPCMPRLVGARTAKPSAMTGGGAASRSCKAAQNIGAGPQVAKTDTQNRPVRVALAATVLFWLRRSMSLDLNWNVSK